jgi:hypothetical protein
LRGRSPIRVNDARGCASGKFLTCIQNDPLPECAGYALENCTLLGMWGGRRARTGRLARAEGWSVGELMA